MNSRTGLKTRSLLLKPQPKAMERSSETLDNLYKLKPDWEPKDFHLNGVHFNILPIDASIGKNDGRTAKRYVRKDFYKIALVKGRSLFNYGDKQYETTGATLSFFNPLVPYKWQATDENCSGMFCIFNDSFFTEHHRTNLRDLPLFRPGHKPIYDLNDIQSAEIERIFQNMADNLASTYRFKYDLIRNYIVEILHLALKMQEGESTPQPYTANARITSEFIALLAKQFPIEAPHQQIIIRSARDFADKLSVHVNHLNRAIKETTGKTTSTLIAERMTIEAKALLKHTNWSISEISYCLGFEDMAHFDNFFKKQTSSTPSAYRAGLQIYNSPGST